MATRINLNGIHELQFPTGVTSASTAGGSTTINLSGNANGIALETNGTPNASQTTLNLVAGANVTLTSDSSGDVTIAAAPGTGTVTSVALAAPSRFTVTGSPVTSSGTLTITDNTQPANEVFAGPASGSAAAPSFRSIVSADLPVATASAPGAVKPDGTSTTVNSSGAISTVNNGTVTSVALTVPSRQAVTGSPITGSGTLGIIDNVQTANTVFAGPSSGSSVAPTFRTLASADLPLATTSAPGAVKPDGSTITINNGVISAASGASNATALQGVAVSSTAPTSGQVLEYNGTQWAPATAASGGGGGFGNGEAALTAPVLSAFTQTNFGTTGTSTVAESFSAGGSSGIRLRERGTGGNANNLRSLLQALPATGLWTVTARLRSQTLITSWQGLGLVLNDSVSGGYLFYGWAHDNGPLSYVTWTSASSYGSPSNVPADYIDYDAWFQIHYDGTNLNFQYSRDGNYFVTLKQTTATAYLAHQANHAGIGINPNCTGNALQETVLECFSFTIVNS